MSYEVGQIIIDEESEAKFEIQVWNIADILNHVVESADFDEFDGTPSMWAYLLASKGGDEQTPALLEKIIDEGFTDPICLYRGFYGGLALGNGHHRLTCAILLGIDEIPVLYTETGEYYPAASEGEDIDGWDEEVSEWIYKQYTKIYKKLQKDEAKAEKED